MDMQSENMVPQREGKVARAIEKQTSKIPSDFFLWTGAGAAVLSLGMQLFGAKQRANFVATWVPTLLLFGLYNKIVKVAGHDKYERNVS